MNKRIIQMIYVIGVILFSAALLPAQTICGYTIHSIYETPHPYGGGSVDAPVVWSVDIQQKGATWLKVHFLLFDIEDEDYMELVDASGTAKYQIKGIDVRSKELSIFKIIENPDGSLGFWAPSIQGDRMTIELHSVVSQHSRWGFAIDKVGIGTLPLEMAILSVCESIDWRDQVCFSGTLKYTRACAVAYIFWEDDGEVWKSCTGSLISCSGTNHFLTNHHCVSSQQDVNSMEAWHNYTTTTCGGSQTSPVLLVSFGDQLITTSANFDFALLTLLGNPQVACGFLAPLAREPVQGESIYIVQHPQDLPKKIAEGSVNSPSVNMPCGAYTPNSDLNYYVDTEAGSSGSPVTSSTGQQHVIGLHHCGNCPNHAVKMSKIYPLIKNYIGCSSPPTAPGNLTAFPTAYNQIDLTWQDNSNNEIEFQVERTTNPPNFSALATVAKNTTRYEDKSATMGTTYFYRVKAYNPEGVFFY